VTAQLGPSTENKGGVLGGAFIDGTIRGIDGKKEALRNSAAGAINDMFNQAVAVDAGKRAANAAVDSALTQIRVRAGEIPYSTTGYGQYTSPSQPLPHFARGAVVMRPTTAVIGEIPEVVAPLSKLTDIIQHATGGGGKGDTYVTVHVQGNVIADQDLSQFIQTEIKANDRRNG